MGDGGTSGPPTEVLESAFHVYEVRTDGDRVLYFGEPLVPQDRLIERVWPAFRDAGYEVRYTTPDRVDVDLDPDPGSPADVDPPTGSTLSEGNPRDGPESDRDPSEGSGSWVRDRSRSEGTPAPGGGSPPGTARADGARRGAVRNGHVLVAEPVSIGLDGIPWTNVVLAFATILSTLYAGSLWYHIDPGSNPAAILQAWPFALAIMGVLGVHEFGHYLMSRYHGVNASLPYFIPVPTLIGTMGAVIKMRGRMPDRKALFDIGVAGPLAGLVATVVVTAVGLHLDPVTVPEAVQNSQEAVQIRIGFPPLMYLIAWAVDQPLNYPAGQAVNPVVIGGWVGMFVTFLNLIPVGQLDGGHIVRAILGRGQERVAALVPAVMFGLGGYLYFVREVPGNAVFIWVFWGLFATFLAFVGPAHPVEDESLDRTRVLVGLLTLVVGLLCFTPVPIAIVE